MWKQVEQNEQSIRDYEKMAWPQFTFLRFCLEILDLLNSLLLPKKRNERFFKGIETYFEDKSTAPSADKLKKILRKFYQNAFGSKDLKEVQQINSEVTIDENNCLSFRIQKEEVANYEEECFDYMLDIDEYHARRRRTFKSSTFHRTNFHEYYLRYFISKSGVKILLDFAKGLSGLKSSLPGILNTAPKEMIIKTKYLLPIMKLVFGIISNMHKLKKYDSNISFDGNWVKNSQLLEEENLLKKEQTQDPSEERVLNQINRPVTEVQQQYFSQLGALGLEYISRFSLEDTFKNKLSDFVEMLIFVEQILSKIKSFQNGSKIIDQLSVKAEGNKISKKFFLNTLQNIIKLYLENPNYTQKMAVADFLNNLSSSVGQISNQRTLGPTSNPNFTASLSHQTLSKIFSKSFITKN